LAERVSCHTPLGPLVLMDADLDRLARRQHSLLTCRQLHGAGWSGSAIVRAVDAFELFVVRRAVFRTAGAIETADMARMAAVLATNGHAVLSGLSTLAAFGFGYFPPADSLHLLTCGDQRPRMPGVTGHRTLWLPPHDLTRVRFIPTTTPERAFVDCCGVLDEKTLGLAGDDALRRKLMSIAKLVRCFEQCPPSGRRKSAPMIPFLAARVKGYDPGGSQPELDLRRDIERAGYDPPVLGFKVIAEGFTHYIDLAWPATKHGLEYQGEEIHGNPSALHRDAARTGRLQRAGWTIYPVTKYTTMNEILAVAAIATGLSAN